MSNFIDKFCTGFFVQDNSKLMREQILTIRYLIAFHDPQLAQHLHSIGLGNLKVIVGPEFYAIPWIMTFFAHIFPIPKLYHLWDHILAGPEFLNLYMAVAIIKQFRHVLLESDFTNVLYKLILGYDYTYRLE